MYKNYETNVMRDSLIKYLEKIKNDIDHLFITGDVANKGSDYGNEVINFLDSIIETLEIEKSKVFIVPGNHDIKRDSLANRLEENIVKSENVRDEINNLDQATYQALISRQNPFFDFYKEYLGEEYPKDKLHFVKKSEKVNVLHINTCLVGGVKEGEILVNLNKLYESIVHMPDNGILNIAIGHHTVGCIHTSEQESLLNRLSDAKIDLYLSGHVHKANYRLESGNYNEMYLFTSGSVMVDEFADPMFITGVFDNENGEGEIVFHRWDKAGEYWRVDNSVGRKVSEGSYRFEVERFKKKDDYVEHEKMDVNEEEFKEFLIIFHNTLESEGTLNSELIAKDIREKFYNMSCSNTFQRQFDKHSILFPFINKVFNSTAFIAFDKRMIIPNVIISEYQNELYKVENGDLILLGMVNNLYEKYNTKLPYSEENLKFYIRVLIYWSINECDIYNEDKRSKGVV
jgi:3',5'-cyclic AMP phosphodiesterase CpdA